jgi:hypothetical protein
MVTTLTIVDLSHINLFDITFYMNYFLDILLSSIFNLFITQRLCVATGCPGQER